MRREEAQAVYDGRQSERSASPACSIRSGPTSSRSRSPTSCPARRSRSTISYVETLKYEDGSYELSFPMVVGPRYIPGTPTGTRARATRPTRQVPDASRITPPVMRDGMRAGHDISVEVALDAGVPIDGARFDDARGRSRARVTTARAVVRLKNQTDDPEQRFRPQVRRGGRQDRRCRAHAPLRARRLLHAHPPAARARDRRRRDAEGAGFRRSTLRARWRAFRIEKAKETMKLALDGLYPQDTFNLITFSGDTHILFPEPVPATPENLREGAGVSRDRARAAAARR